MDTENNLKIKKYAELSFALYLASKIEQEAQKGRLKNSCQKLEAAVLEQFKGAPKFTNPEMQTADKIIDAFLDKTGWKKGKHIVTTINFLLAVMDKKPYGEESVVPALMEIFNYFDRVRDAPKACEWAAGKGHEKWEETCQEIIPHPVTELKVKMLKSFRRN